MYDFYSGVYPLPNDPSIADLDGNNNLFSDPPVPFDYWAIPNRVDWVATQKDRFFFRWSWNKFANERQDWSYNTYPHMTGLTQSEAPIGENKYNSMIVRLEHRFAHGLSLNAHYEWSHTMSRDWFANAFDAEPIWRESDLSRPMRWVTAGVCDLPIGKGKPLLANSRWGSRLLGGWQLGVVMQRQSGECIDFGNVFWYGSDYRDIMLPADARTQDRWFNIDQFERNSARVPTSFHRRVFPSRMNWLRTEVMMQVDANLQKNIPFTESVRASFRVDLINALNKQVLGNPSVNPLDTNFGRVSSFVNTPRLIQLTFRLNY